MTDAKQAALEAAKAEAEKAKNTSGQTASKAAAPAKPAETKPAAVTPSTDDAQAQAQAAGAALLAKKAEEAKAKADSAGAAGESNAPKADAAPTSDPNPAPAGAVAHMGDVPSMRDVVDTVSLPPIDESEFVDLGDLGPGSAESYEEWHARQSEPAPLVTAPGGDYMALPEPQATPVYTLGPRDPNKLVLPQSE